MELPHGHEPSELQPWTLSVYKPDELRHFFLWHAVLGALVTGEHLHEDRLLLSRYPLTFLVKLDSQLLRVHSLYQQVKYLWSLRCRHSHGQQLPDLVSLDMPNEVPVDVLDDLGGHGCDLIAELVHIVLPKVQLPSLIGCDQVLHRLRL